MLVIGENCYSCTFPPANQPRLELEGIDLQHARKNLQPPSSRCQFLFSSNASCLLGIATSLPDNKASKSLDVGFSIVEQLPNGKLPQIVPCQSRASSYLASSTREPALRRRTRLQGADMQLESGVPSCTPSSWQRGERHRSGTSLARREPTLRVTRLRGISHASRERGPWLYPAQEATRGHGRSGHFLLTGEPR